MERDSTDEDVTSDFAESTASASEFTSINTGRILYSYEHGRRYQAFLHGRYGLPNDDVEQTREGIKHKLYTDYLLEGKLFLAPIGDHPQKIVDLGTGVGFWAQDVAESFPSARVIGTDLSPIQPHWTSPNVEFRVEDLEDEHRPWTSIYVDADFIHIRALLQTLRNPTRLIQRSFENIKPGGWIECHEVIPFVFSDDGTAGDDHPMNAMYRLVEGPFSEVYGWQLRFPNKMPDVLRETGFINIQERHNKVPLGRWHSEAKMREIGMFCQSLIEDWVDALIAKPDALGLSHEEGHRLAEDITGALNNPRIHARLDWIDCWAQKPLS